MNPAHMLIKAACSSVATGAVAMIALFLTVTAPVWGQTPIPTDPFLVAYSVRPATGGWYQPDSNFGNLNFDISDSGIAAGTWSTYGDNGVTWYYFQGTITYPTIEQTQGNQVTAVVESPIYRVVSGSACLTCAYVPAVVAPSGDNVRIEFSSSRVGRFILNGTTSIPITAWVEGLPLLAARDYSGEWLAVARMDYLTSTVPFHVEAVVQVRLEALDGPAIYHEIVAPVITSPLAVEPPETNARRYRFSCIAPEESCLLVERRILRLEPLACPECVADEQFLMLWLNPNEAGQLGQVRDEADSGYGLIRGVPNSLAYGERDRILIRSSVPQAGFLTPVFREIVLQRLPAGMFDAGKLWQGGRLDAQDPFVPFP